MTERQAQRAIIRQAMRTAHKTGSADKVLRAMEREYTGVSGNCVLHTLTVGQFAAVATIAVENWWIV